MRINTSGKKAWRTDLYERTADVLGESTKTGAIDSACIHAKQDIEAKQEVVEYLTDHLPAGELETVAELLSTDVVAVRTGLETEIETER